ncbi:MAG: cobalamin-binding protein [Nitrospiraceae bacterium]|nr:cobalamin-binding protein [Nitrospiraceae bacterium]
MNRRQQGILTGMPFMANLAPRTFVDDIGRKIYLAKAPTRIISTAPSVTEMLFAIGLNQEIVGVTQFCDYPPAARTKPKIGYSNPNIESILALKPDLVIAPRESLRIDMLGQLDRLKIPTFILEAKIVEDIPSHIQTLGRMFDRSPAADRVATGMRERIAEIRKRIQTLPRPRLLYVLNSQPLISVGPGSFIHQLIELAGGTNVAAAAKSAYPRLNMEDVLKEDPQIILFPVGSSEGIPDEEQQVWRKWTTVSAVQHGRVLRISADLLNRPGPRIIDGLEVLARLLHPDVFAGGTP